MTLHYHGTPITPLGTLRRLAGKNFCVSFADPRDVDRCHEIGQSVMLDNGAFTAWKANYQVDWVGYYAWCERWLSHPKTWAVIPDIIGGDVKGQDALIKAWPFAHRGSPVWHMNEPLDRLLRLCDEWPRVCIGSAQEYSKVMSPLWWARIVDAFELMQKGRRFIPDIHMLRGMACIGRGIPFGSVDSTDVARNHHLASKDPRIMAERWDAIQCGSVILKTNARGRLRHKLWREGSVL